MKEYIVLLDEEEAFYGYKDNAQELIRCKDCARWVTEDGKTGQCLEFSKVLFRHATIAEFFCAMATPKDKP